MTDLAQSVSSWHLLQWEYLGPASQVPGTSSDTLLHESLETHVLRRKDEAYLLRVLDTKDGAIRLQIVENKPGGALVEEDEAEQENRTWLLERARTQAVVLIRKYPLEVKPLPSMVDKAIADTAQEFQQTIEMLGQAALWNLEWLDPTTHEHLPEDTPAALIGQFTSDWKASYGGARIHEPDEQWQTIIITAYLMADARLIVTLQGQDGDILSITEEPSVTEVEETIGEWMDRTEKDWAYYHVNQLPITLHLLFAQRGAWHVIAAGAYTIDWRLFSEAHEPEVPSLDEPVADDYYQRPSLATIRLDLSGGRYNVVYWESNDLGKQKIWDWTSYKAVSDTRKEILSVMREVQNSLRPTSPFIVGNLSNQTVSALLNKTAHQNNHDQPSDSPNHTAPMIQEITMPHTITTHQEDIKPTQVTIPPLLQKVMPRHQQQFLRQIAEEEVDGMQRILDRLEQAWQNMPAFRAQDGKGKQAVVHAHYFKGSSDWWITEYNPKEHMAYGYVILNGDTQFGEFGNIYLPDLTATSVELDFHWQPVTVQEALAHEEKTASTTDQEAPDQEDEQVYPHQDPTAAPLASDASLWIDDNYYAQHPTHVYDEFFYKSGRYGEAKSIRTTDTLAKSLARMDTSGASLPSQRADFSEENHPVSRPKEQVTTKKAPIHAEDHHFEKAITRSSEELAHKAQAQKKRAKKRQTTASATETSLVTSEDLAIPDEAIIFSAEEVAHDYNEGLTEEDFKLFAYYKRNQKQPLGGYYAQFGAPSESEVLDWMQRGKAFYYQGEILPDYIYLSENIYAKQDTFRRERSLITSKYGFEIVQRQEKALEAVFQQHSRNRLLLDHRLPDGEQLSVELLSSFSETFQISTLVGLESFKIKKVTATTHKRAGQPDFLQDHKAHDYDRVEVSSMSLKDAFCTWLIKQENNITFKKQVTSRDIISVHVFRRPRPRDFDPTAWSAHKAACKQEADRLYTEFLSTEVVPEDRSKIETAWNREFNNYLPIDYTRVPIAFRMAKTYRDSPVDIRSEKRDAVTFLLAQGSGCLAYDVGFGKTWSAIFAMSQFLDAQLCYRPLLVVPNQVYKQFLMELKGLMPHIPVNEYYNLDAKHLAYAQDHPPEDGSITILTYEGFKKIGFNEQTSRELIRELLEILSQGYDKQTRKKMQAQREKMEERIGQGLQGTIIEIEQFGWDFLCVDEAHSMKKVFTSVKGEVQEDGDREKNQYEISSGTPSAMATKGFMIAQYILRRNHYRNVLLLTATPFTNSPLEVYSMLSLVAYQGLQKAGVKSIKTFYDQYVAVDTKLVINAQLEPQRKQVVTGFSNLKSLQALIYRYFDRKDINTKNAKGEGVQIKRPKKHVLPMRTKMVEDTSGQPQLIYLKEAERIEPILPLTEEQQEIMDSIKRYASGEIAFEQLCVGFGEVVVEGDTEVEDEEAVDETATELLDIAMLSEGEQAGVRLLRSMNLARNLALSPYLHKCSNLPPLSYKTYVETSPKLYYVMQCIRSVKEYHEQQGTPVSGQVIYMDRGVDHFLLLKEYLVQEIGYEPHEVGLMRSNMASVKPKGVKTTEAKDYVKNLFLGQKWVESKKEFVEVPDAERIKVVIGTGTIKEGVNLQRYGTVLYNCFIDWNPTDQIQLEGRIWRQGNLYKHVRIVNVLMEDSADIFLFQKLEEKTQRINQLWNRDGNTNTFNLDEFDPEELKYTLISDPAVIAQLEVEEEVGRLQDEKYSLSNEITQIESVMEAFRDRKRYEELVLPELQKLHLIIPEDKEDDIAYLSAKLATIVKTQKLPLDGDLEGKAQRVSILEYFEKGAGLQETYSQRKYQPIRPYWFTSYARAQRLTKRFEENYLVPKGWTVESLPEQVAKLQEKIAAVDKRGLTMKSPEAMKSRAFRIMMEREEAQISSKSLDARVEDFKSLNHLLDERKEVLQEAKDEAPTVEEVQAALEGLTVLRDISEGAEKEEVSEAIAVMEILLELAA